jgi:hypothetical protein
VHRNVWASDEREVVPKVPPKAPGEACGTKQLPEDPNLLIERHVIPIPAAIRSEPVLDQALDRILESGFERPADNPISEMRACGSPALRRAARARLDLRRDDGDFASYKSASELMAANRTK